MDGHGYRFENRLARRYNASGWRAWRLGASSLGLPDILAVNSTKMHVHELKSTTTKRAVRIPAHQIERCLDIASSFARYDGRVVLSARFGRVAEYHCIWNGTEPEPVTINIRGKVLGCDAETKTWDELLGAG